MISFFQAKRYSLKGVSIAIIVTLLSQHFYPTLHAAQTGKLIPQASSPQEAMHMVHKALQGLHVRLAQLEHDSASDRSHALDRVEELQGEVEANDAKVLEYFAQERETLIAKNLPEVILKRHDDMVKHYTSQRMKLLNKTQQRLERERGSLWQQLQTYLPFQTQQQELEESPHKDLNPNKFQRSNQKFDPNDLPTNISKPNPDNKPKLNRADFTLSGLLSTPTQHYAALGDFKYDTLADASEPAYLDPSDAVVLTDDIKAKAQELEYDAVKIYHWVRNNIEWVPSWGSVQNAQLTLETLRGNSHDISALTIALLRASKIPARFVHGAISVPSEKFNNWAGGFSDVEGAGTYAGASGVPLGYIAEGGKIAYVQLEHIWVEAATDYYPSRGAKNHEADIWLEFDPSYKQYEFVEGIDTLKVSGIDVEALTNEILSSTDINETTGAMSNMDTTALENALADAQIKLTDYVENNMTDPSVLDVIGGKKTIVQEYPTLPSSLPNQVLVSGARYAALPSALQQKITISLSSSDPYAAIYGTLPSITLPYAKVNNEKVTLSFKPATQADEDTLNSYLPDGNITDISQLPSELPANLIEVIPEVKLNGEVVLSGDIMKLGEEIDVSMTPYIPGLGNIPKQTHTTIAGSYLSLNVVAQSVSPKKLKDLQIKLEQTKSILQSNDQTALASITREDLLGDMMYAGTLSYFAQLQAQHQLAALASKAKTGLLAAKGIFGYEPKITYLFGLPRTISSGGIHLDIETTQVSRSLDNDNQKTIDFIIQTSPIGSALEHQVPEQMFNTDPNNPTQAISTVKALQLANAQGQQIYKIDQTNIDTTLPKLNLSNAIKQDIQQAINQGKYAITHTDNISVPGWSGAGYAIIDPQTGDNAYMISGGSNGGFFLIAMGSLVLWAALAAWGFSGGASIFLGGAMVELLTVVIIASSLFIAAGVSAILGDSAGCRMLYRLAVATLSSVLRAVNPLVAMIINSVAQRNASNLCGA